MAFLLVFLAKLATQMTVFNRHAGRVSMRRLATVLLLGVMSTVVAFNDYQMSNYAGLVMLGFISRLIGQHNEADDRVGRQALPSVAARRADPLGVLT